MVIPGGISEMLTQSPSNSRRGIVPVIRRTGFIRAALRHGVPLVPIFGANVNEMYAVAIYRWQAFRDLVGMFPLMCAAPPSRHCDPSHTDTLPWISIIIITITIVSSSVAVGSG